MTGFAGLGVLLFIVFLILDSGSGSANERERMRLCKEQELKDLRNSMEKQQDQAVKDAVENYKRTQNQRGSTTTASVETPRDDKKIRIYDRGYDLNKIRRG